jgi:hypothetical protein
VVTVVDVQRVREIQHRAKWGSAGASSVSFVVPNLDNYLEMFAVNGIRVVSQYTTNGFPKTATVSDPAGSLVTFVDESSPLARNLHATNS